MLNTISLHLLKKYGIMKKGHGINQEPVLVTQNEFIQFQYKH